MPEPIDTPATTPSGPDQRPATDPVARLVALTTPRPTTPIFGRAPSASPAPAAAAPAPSTPTPPPPAAATPTAPTPVAPTATAPTPAAPTPAAPTPAAPTPGEPSLGRLSRVPATELWANDAAMTAWLAAQPEGVTEAIDIALRDVRGTAPGRLDGLDATGAPFSAVCEVGVSSADGLGRLLAAASVQDAGTIAWIAGEPDATHGSTVSWLNRATPVRFFVVRVTGVRIGSSASAPVFEVVVRPGRSTDHGSGLAAAGSVDGRRADDHGTGG